MAGQKRGDLRSVRGDALFGSSAAGRGEQKDRGSGFRREVTSAFGTGAVASPREVDRDQHCDREDPLESRSDPQRGGHGKPDGTVASSASAHVETNDGPGAARSSQGPACAAVIQKALSRPVLGPVALHPFVPQGHGSHTQKVCGQIRCLIYTIRAATCWPYCGGHSSIN